MLIEPREQFAGASFVDRIVIHAKIPEKPGPETVILDLPLRPSQSVRDAVRANPVIAARD